MMDRRTLAWATALFGLFGLIVALTVWHAWISPPRELPRALILIIAVGPLFLPMRGLLHGHPRTGWLETTLALCLFAGSMFYARLEGRRRRRILEQNSGQGE